MHCKPHAIYIVCRFSRTRSDHSQPLSSTPQPPDQPSALTGPILEVAASPEAAQNIPSARVQPASAAPDGVSNFSGSSSALQGGSFKINVGKPALLSEWQQRNADHSLSTESATEHFQMLPVAVDSTIVPTATVHTSRPTEAGTQLVTHRSPPIPAPEQAVDAADPIYPASTLPLSAAAATDTHKTQQQYSAAALPAVPQLALSSGATVEAAGSPGLAGTISGAQAKETVRARESSRDVNTSSESALRSGSRLLNPLDLVVTADMHCV